MNRLVIIGNGFDLAHGLPTGYCDFIANYWKKVVSSFWHGRLNFEDDVISIKINPDFNTYAFNPVRQLGQGKELDEVNSYSSFKKFIECFSYVGPDNCCQINYKNDFFEILNQIHSVQNWVDVENEYYKLLKECLKRSDNETVKEINEQFDRIKKCLETYLIDEVENKYDFQNLDNGSFENLLFPEFSPNFTREDYLMEFLQKEMGGILNFLSDLRRGYGTVSTHIVNFNYTSLVEKYLEKAASNSSRTVTLNHIHGQLNNHFNPINFGFGDEMDKHYSEIEDKDDNEYLRNIKSFQYLHTPNYKRLLDLIDSDKFQVYIMGHSCGLSDRTLLNTIFEHENCISIKVFYHQKEDGNDNYTEITQNISRHFNKKKLMREKIVNKTLCEPMPQIQLPKKENGL